MGTQVVYDNHAEIRILKENNFKNLNTLATFPPIIVDNYIKDIEMIKKGGEFKWAPLKNTEKKT